MKHWIRLATALLATLALAPCARAEPTALEILERADDQIDLRQSEIEFEMQVYRDNELRKTYRMALKYGDAWHMLAETLYPPRNEGEKMLQSGARNSWLFLPNINKAIRVSESNSFSNGDFSNTDILSPRLSSDYTPKLLGSELLNNEPAYKLELEAKHEDTPYARIHYWVRKSDAFPLKREYYTHSQKLLKQLDIQRTAAFMPRGVPDTFVMSSVLERDKKTVIRYLKYRQSNFPAGTFDENALMRR